MSRRECLFIINPQGGSGKAKRQWERLRGDVRTRLKEKYNVIEKYTQASGDATLISREAVLQGIDCIVAVGGDGTTNEVANGFFDQGQPVWDYDPSKQSPTPCPTKLAIVPLGTGSDLVRSIGWNRDIFSAIQRIRNGETTLIDVGMLRATNDDQQLEQRAFVNATTCGMGALTCIHAKRYQWLPGPLAYYLAVASGLLFYRGQPVSIRLDNKDEQIRLKDATLVSVCNGQYFGGGMKVAPGASMTDGKFDVISIDQHGFGKFVMRGHHLRRGTYQDGKTGKILLDGITRNLASKVSIKAEDSKKEGLMFEVDGEVWGRLPASIDIFPNAIELIT
eukprot:TRINITY_DN10857_c1_g1_i1.p1 TRINITY_DN10857_c1_g1~~TRINITY_DN10857_c1_g1_i1.p1  ORF type:complete len:389 (-),score=34.23 TRINITY_DN10857_c1_g1_i1:527-1531(-)